jgi:acetyl-CoA carboxylase biotin carboxyl carrier protein
MTTMRAEMVASVHSVEVKEGAVVSAGDTLMIMESMKMEIPVLAERDGTVIEVSVKPGDVVQEGDALVVLG